MVWRQKLIRPGKTALRFATYGAAFTATGICAYSICNRHEYKLPATIPSSVFKYAACASPVIPQDAVISQPKKHAVYLTIHLESNADATACVKALSNLQASIDTICPPDMRDESDEILVGVGFGPNFLSRVHPSYKSSSIQHFPYIHRKGALGDMPATGGDIFIHGKCDEHGKLFELTQAMLKMMPANSVAYVDEVYGWTYRNGRDLTGFIDGTENPADDESRTDVAINKKTGGSYVITQKWVHKHDVISSEKDSTKEGWIGRTLADSTELKKLPKTSHVFRMDPRSPDAKEPKLFEIVRQSQPWGSVTGKSGLFFIAYAAQPANFDFMLDQMTGAGSNDKHCDDVMRMTQCVSGAYFYVPSQSELKDIVSQSNSCSFWK